MSVAAETIRHMFEEVSLGAPENAIGFVFWRITARYQREMDRALLPLALTNLQFVTLALVGWFGRSESAVTQAELARFCGMHPMQLSLMLKALEGKSFVQRERSRLDSRAKEVAVTPEGLHALQRALPVAIEVQNRLFGEAGRKGGALYGEVAALDARLERGERTGPDGPDEV